MFCFFFHHVKYIIPLLSGFHDFWCEVNSYSYWGSLVCKSYISPAILKILFDFGSSSMMCVCVNIFWLILLIDHWTTWLCRFIKCFFSFRNSQYIYTGVCDGVTQNFETIMVILSYSIAIFLIISVSLLTFSICETSLLYTTLIL